MVRIGGLPLRLQRAGVLLPSVLQRGGGHDLAFELGQVDGLRGALRDQLDELGMDTVQAGFERQRRANEAVGVIQRDEADHGGHQAQMPVVGKKGQQLGHGLGR